MNNLMFRPGTEQDRPFMSDCIRKTLKHQPWSKDLSHEAISMLVDPILATAQVLVLVPVVDPGSIVGFIVYSRTENTVHWLHVRKPFRLRNYGTNLLEAAGIRPGPVRCSMMVNTLPSPYTNVSGHGETLQDVAVRHGYKLRFRPWIVLEILAVTKGYA